MVNYEILRTLGLVTLESFENCIGFYSKEDKKAFYYFENNKIKRQNEKPQQSKKVTVKSPVIIAYLAYAIFASNSGLILVNGIPINGLPFLGMAVIAIIKMIPKKEVRQTHAAEHMLVLALARLGYIPNLEEIKKFGKKMSRFCGTNSIGHVISILIVQAITSSLPGMGAITFLCTLGVEFIVLGMGEGTLSPWQLLTISQPTDTQLTLAIKGLEYWVEENIP